MSNDLVGSKLLKSVTTPETEKESTDGYKENALPPEVNSDSLFMTHFTV